MDGVSKTFFLVFRYSKIFISCEPKSFEFKEINTCKMSVHKYFCMFYILSWFTEINKFVIYYWKTSVPSELNKCNKNTFSIVVMHLLIILYCSALAAFSITLLCCLSVLLRQAKSHSGQELVHSHMDLRGEVSREHDGDDHHDALRQDLWRAPQTHGCHHVAFCLKSTKT